ncbi:MAG: type IV secretory system conjugative DNA transfer family protein [Gammaproteobacteria bacterium]|nr:type IV secretory system conjugative DNA transfer family protein [Gammaproteobacteria bacterium]
MPKINLFAYLDHSKLYRLILSTMLSATLCSCFYTGETNLEGIDTTDIYQLENIRVQARVAPSSHPSGSPIRTQALQESALSMGAQSGLAWASTRMNTRMSDDRKYLDTIFNFNGMMLTHGVIPPVLVEGDFSLNLADPNTIRVADRTYKIVKQARFATTPPNWREYLWLQYPAPRLPDRTLLPRTLSEQRVWREGIRAGWERGIQQGYSIFQENMARLKRDFRGMILYRKLLQERMISPPFVSRTELGVTGDGSDMRINDQVLRIVELPQLQTSAKGWKAIVVKQ